MAEQRKAAIPVPIRIKEDLVDADGRQLKFFLQNMKERIDDLEKRLAELED
ncbi:MAG: hypothetical protein ACREAE_09510 [Nitrosopumilaceae archaeon]